MSRSTAPTGRPRIGGSSCSSARSAAVWTPSPCSGRSSRTRPTRCCCTSVNDPRGVALVSMSEDPTFFVTGLREVLNAEPFAGLSQKPELTMFGRTYASGFETDLEDWLLRRPRRAALNPAWPWGIWYPLRRSGSFGKLTPQEQGAIIREHSVLGRAYGDADLAHDVRLACHGLDVHDNDFVIGLVGRRLHPLSHLVQAMRKTTQTSQYLQTLGPFFV